MNFLEFSNVQGDGKRHLEAMINGSFVCLSCNAHLPLKGLPPEQIHKCPKCDAENVIPRKLSKFWLFSTLVANNEFTFYKAYHEDFPNRLFGVKVLPSEKKGNPELIKELANESEIVHEMGDHPCILNGLECGFGGGRHFLATEYIEGERLDQYIERLGRLKESEVLLIALRLLSAESHIYNHGYLYRDLRPENIIISNDTSAYLYSFRLSLPIRTAFKGAGDLPKGSQFYISPEQHGGGEGVYSEIYSLGMVLYHALTGQTYHSTKELKRFLQHVSDETTLIIDSAQSKMKTFTPEVGEILTKMVKRAPFQRYQTFFEAERDIMRVLNDRF